MSASKRNAKKRRRQARAAASVAGPPLEPSERFSIMAKPIGPACNLRCAYCFYLEKDALFADGADRRMADAVLEAFVRKYIAAQPSGTVAFHWQGGEPTLMGVAFFEKAMALQRRYGGHKRVTNTLQTNGTFLDDAWGRMLHENHWLVGISLDGPSEVHNPNRSDAAGGGSFDAVMRGLDVLKRHRVQFNVLASVTPLSTADPLAVYKFLTAAGATFIQFMPIVERLPDEAARELGLQLAVGVRQGEEIGEPRMTPWSVQPEAYGEFLIRIFDRWVRHDVGDVAVMNFEWALANYLRRPAQVCQFMPVCGRAPILEHNGDLYACDHYVYPAYRLGNIVEDDLAGMIRSRRLTEFGKAKFDGLPDVCKHCPVLGGCWGECPKRRFGRTPDGQPGLNYLCAGYKAFLSHAAPWFEAMARLRLAGEPIRRIMELDVRVVPGASITAPARERRTSNPAGC